MDALHRTPELHVAIRCRDRCRLFRGRLREQLAKIWSSEAEDRRVAYDNHGSLRRKPPPWDASVLDPSDIYSADAPGNFTSITRTARPLVYVPDTLSDDVEEIDPSTYQVIARYPMGSLPQHVVPS